MRLALVFVASFVTIAVAAAAPGDSRDDPVPMGESARVVDYAITVTGYNPDGTQIVQDYMDDGQEPRDGTVWALVRATITYTGNGIGSARQVGDPSYIDSGNRQLSGTKCGDATTWRLNGGNDAIDLFPDGSVEIIYCAEVTPAQAANLFLYFKGDDVTPVFFALEPTPLASPSASPVT